MKMYNIKPKNGFMVVKGADTFLGDDCQVLRKEGRGEEAWLQECRDLCASRGWGGFVTFHGVAYFRSQSPESCWFNVELNPRGGLDGDEPDVHVRLSEAPDLDVARYIQGACTRLWKKYENKVKHTARGYELAMQGDFRGLTWENLQKGKADLEKQAKVLLTAGAAAFEIVAAEIWAFITEEILMWSEEITKALGLRAQLKKIVAAHEWCKKNMPHYEDVFNALLKLLEKVGFPVQ